MMQNIKWKKNKDFLFKTLEKIIFYSSEIGIKYIVFPLVDNSSLKSVSEIKILIKNLKGFESILKKYKVQILFESDFSAKKLLSFIKNFNPKYYGINYDTGNSQYRGYNMDEEFYYYGSFIKNVHIKDSNKLNKTLPLGQGSVNFTNLFKNLKSFFYKGILIMQTARAKDDRLHAKELIKNREFLIQKIN